MELKIVLLYKLGIALHIRIIGCCVGANFAKDMIKETAAIHVSNKFALITFFLTADQSVKRLTAERELAGSIPGRDRTNTKGLIMTEK